jgi:hypothetical protein
MPTLDAAEVEARVRAIGRAAGPASFREWRWAVPVDEAHLAFVADDDEGWVRLRREEALFARLRGRVCCEVPAIVTMADAPRVMIRRMVPGIQGAPLERLVFGRHEKQLPGSRYAPDLPLTPEGRRFAADLGRAIAEIQRAVTAADAGALGFACAGYLGLLDDVEAALAPRAELADLRASIPPLRAWFAALPDERALCLRDVQMHNVAVDPATGALAGLFDVDDAAVAHRFEDFKYLPSFGVEFARVAIDAFARAGESPPTLEHVGRFHVLSALEHFLFVPEGTARWAEIVEWTRAAIARFVP